MLYLTLLKKPLKTTHLHFLINIIIYFITFSLSINLIANQSMTLLLKNAIKIK
jgi:hypothetical protein